MELKEWKKTCLDYSSEASKLVNQFAVILANPPFGGKEKEQIQQNFPVQATATELLFLQYFMKYLKKDGKAGIIFPEGILFQTGSAFRQVKQELLENFNVHTIISLPAGIFLPYSGVKTNVVFFDRKGGTKQIWYYELNLPNKLTKNKPILFTDFDEFIRLYKTPKERGKTKSNDWTVSINEIISRDYDLSAKNPNLIVDDAHLGPLELISMLQTNDSTINNLLSDIKSLVQKSTN